MIQQLEITLIAALIAAACSLPGAFLVLRRMAMMSDAISHAILPGIVIAFFIVRDLNSPLLIIGAALTGVLTVTLVEALNRSGLIRSDAAMGIVFPFLFSVGVILISRFAGNIHLDTDAVLLGELAMAPFNRLVAAGQDIGPKGVYIGAAILLLNGGLITVFYKELKVSTFDAGLAAAMGFSPLLLHYLMMTQVSLTTVAAFDAVGAILVIAFMVGAPAAAYLLSEQLRPMLLLSVLFAVSAAVGGSLLAFRFNLHIAGSMAGTVGVLFTAVFVVSPRRGVLALLRRRRRNRLLFAVKMLLAHLSNHDGTPEAGRECQVSTLHEHLIWPAPYVKEIVRFAVTQRYLTVNNGQAVLTQEGRRAADSGITGG